MTMTAHEGKMWNIIGALGWVEAGYDVASIEQLMFDRYDNDTIAELVNFFEDTRANLADEIEKYEVIHKTRCGLYDENDNWLSMLNHVIGMGKLTHDAVLADPRRLDTIEVCDDFGWVIPLTPDAVQFDRERLTT